MGKLLDIKITGLDETNHKKYLWIISRHIKWACKFFGWAPAEIMFIFHKDRFSFDQHWGSKSYNWMVGFHKENTTEIHLIHPFNYEELSVHEYSEKEFVNLLKHEITHLFIGLKFKRYPYLFNEGLALYVSDLFLKDKLLSKVKEKKVIPDFESLFFFEFDYLAASFFSMFLSYLKSKYKISKLKYFVNLLGDYNYKNAFEESYGCKFDEEYKVNFLKWLLQQ